MPAPSEDPRDAPDVEHYFTASPASPAERRRVRVRLAGEETEVETAGGVFSPGRLDLGTEVLLRTVPAPPTTGELLDLGCGWGPLALTLARLSPGARVWAVDVNERALDLARANAARLGRSAVVAARPEDVPAAVRFDVIWSNPPIRVGKEALHRLMRTWLPRLRPSARAYLVVQRNLGADSLQAWLTEQWPGTFDVARVASAKGYRVLEVAAR